MKKFTPEEEVQQTLKSLVRLKRVQASPDFYDKVMAKVSKPATTVIPIYRRWQVAAAIILLAVNAFSLGLYVKQNNNTGQKNYYEALAEDYSLSLTQETIY